MNSGPGMPGAETPPIEGETLPARVERAPVVNVETAATAVAAREKSAVEARFLMALKQPRNQDQARMNILSACRRPRFAEDVEYAKPVGGKDVTGLSIRAAEEMARAWGNIYIRADVVFDDRERRVYRVTGTDLETNYTTDQDVIVEKTVERRSVKQGEEVIGTRLNTRGEKVYIRLATEDDVLTKSNAGLSKARRNLILSLIPSDIREEAVETARETLKNRDAKDPAAARKAILDSFFQIGVTPDQVKAVMGKPLDQLNPAEIQVLRKIYTAVRDGEVTWAEVETDKGLERMRADSKEKPASPEQKGTAGLKAAVGTKPESPVATGTTDASERKLDQALVETGK